MNAPLHEPSFLASLRARLDRRSVVQQALIRQFLDDIYGGEQDVLHSDEEGMAIFINPKLTVLAVFFVTRTILNGHPTNLSMLEAGPMDIDRQTREMIFDTVRSYGAQFSAQEGLDPDGIRIPMNTRAAAILMLNGDPEPVNAYLTHRSIDPYVGLTLLARAAEYQHHQDTMFLSGETSHWMCH